MSYSTTGYISDLYSIQKIMQDAYMMYGPVIAYNPDENPVNTGKPKPTTEQVTNMMGKIGEKLYDLNTNVQQLADSKGSRLYNAKTYYYLVIASIAFLVLVPGLIFVYNLPENLIVWSQEGTLPKNLGIIGVIAVCIILAAVFFMVIANIRFKTFDNIYNQTYKPPYSTGSDYEQAMNNDDEITRLIKMFYGFKEERAGSLPNCNLQGKVKNAKTYMVTTSNPFLVYAFAKKHPLTKPITLRGGDCSQCTFVTKEQSMPKSKSTMVKLNVDGKTYFNTCNFDLTNATMVPWPNKSLVYPFTFDPNRNNRMAINPFVLKRQIQAIDIYGQMYRLRDATDYFKEFLLKVKDAKYSTKADGLSKDVLLKIYNDAIDILGKIGSEVSNFKIIDITKARASQLGKVDCYNTCLADSNCMIAGYDVTKRTCYMVDQPSLTNAKIGYDSNAYPLLVKYTDSNIPIYGDLLDPSYIGANFIKDNACDEKTNGCIVSGNTKLRNTTGDVKFAELYSNAPQSYTQDTKYIMSLQDFTKNGTVDNLLVDNKSYFVDSIVSIVLKLDASNTFVMSQNDKDYITGELKGVLGTRYTMLKGSIDDILNEVGKQLLIEYNNLADEAASKNKGLAKYIPYERFVEKCKELTYNDFVLSFVFNVEELRATSNGLYLIHDKYSYDQEKASRQYDIINKTLIFVPIIAVLIYCISLYFGYQGSALKEIADNGGSFLMVTPVNNFKVTIDFLIKWLIVLLLIVIPLYMLYGWKQQSKAVFSTNYEVLMKNGGVVANSSTEAMTDIYTDFKEVNYNIVKKSKDSSKEYMNLPEFKKGKIVIDPEVSLEGNHENDAMFDYIVNMSTFTTKTTFDLTNTKHHLNDLYDRIVECIDAYDKCNNLFMDFESSLPLPVVPMMIYGLLCISALLIVIWVIVTFKPFAQYNVVTKSWENIKKLRAGMLVNILDLKEAEKPKHFDNAMRVIVLIMIIVFGVGFAVIIENNVSSFESGLRSSDLFRNSECYNL